MAFFRSKITIFAFLVLATMMTGSEGRKLTHIRLYLHDILYGPNNTATSIKVAQSSAANQTATTYGSVYVIDDLLTVGQNSTTATLGRAQGMYYFSGLSEVSLTMTLNFVFTSGRYNGSTIAIHGRNAFRTEAVRELAIVGGTGVFRFASGYTQERTITVDPATYNSIFQYDLYVRKNH